jgi:hypothetical protein
MVNGRSDALALEGYFLALVVDCLSISLDLGMVFTLLLSFYSSQVLFMLGARWEV